MIQYKKNNKVLADLMIFLISTLPNKFPYTIRLECIIITEEQVEEEKICSKYKCFLVYLFLFLFQHLEFSFLNKIIGLNKLYKRAYLTRNFA